MSSQKTKEELGKIIRNLHVLAKQGDYNISDLIRVARMTHDEFAFGLVGRSIGNQEAIIKLILRSEKIGRDTKRDLLNWKKLEKCEKSELLSQIYGHLTTCETVKTSAYQEA